MNNKPFADLNVILKLFSKYLRDRKDVESLFTEDSELTIDLRKHGKKDISENLIQQEKELQFTEFSYLNLDPATTLVNGSCIWGNRPLSFTIVFQHSNSQIFVSNFMIF